jgi:hypothetical protein
MFLWVVGALQLIDSTFMKDIYIYGFKLFLIVLVVLNDVRMVVFLNIFVTTPVYFFEICKSGPFLFLWSVLLLRFSLFWIIF